MPKWEAPFWLTVPIMVLSGTMRYRLRYRRGGKRSQPGRAGCACLPQGYKGMQVCPVHPQRCAAAAATLTHLACLPPCLPAPSTGPPRSYQWVKRMWNKRAAVDAGRARRELRLELIPLPQARRRPLRCLLLQAVLCLRTACWRWHPRLTAGQRLPKHIAPSGPPLKTPINPAALPPAADPEGHVRQLA